MAYLTNDPQNRNTTAAPHPHRAPGPTHGSPELQNIISMAGGGARGKIDRQKRASYFKKEP